jgi:hypothetical protein
LRRFITRLLSRKHAVNNLLVRLHQRPQSAFLILQGLDRFLRSGKLIALRIDEFEQILDTGSRLVKGINLLLVRWAGRGGVFCRPLSAGQ